jgi:diguanylate cyclase (GGDEF)-like protein
MLYQKQVSRNEFITAQLEFFLAHGRVAYTLAQGVGGIALAALLWFYVDAAILLLWLAALLTFLLIGSLRMHYAFRSEYASERREALYVELLVLAAISGALWSGFAIFADGILSDSIFYLMLGFITLILSITTIASVVIHAGVVALVMMAFLPLTSWLVYQADMRPYNVQISILLTGVAVVLLMTSYWLSRSFEDMLVTNLERGEMMREFANLTESLRQRNTQLQQARRELSEMATIDELTGLKNRRALNLVIDDELSRAKRNTLPIALVMVDVDHFKLYNDYYGHPRGDEVLRQVASVLRTVTSRAGELAVRMGGEEFLLLLPGSTRNEALTIAETVRARVNALGIPHETSPTSDNLTVSQGVVVCTPHLETTSGQLIEASDKALYESKRQGRDRISMSQFGEN